MAKDFMALCGDSMITAKQKKYIIQLCTWNGVPIPKELSTMSKMDASALILKLKEQDETRRAFEESAAECGTPDDCDEPFYDYDD